MDFAKRQLEKYGWKEGKGLGRNEDGLATALQAKLKFDNTGVGHEQGKDFTYKWWENVYDNAANNIKVSKNKGDVQVQRVADEVEITTKDYSVKDFKKKNGDMEYGTFLKTAKLTQDGVINYDNVQAPADTGKFQFKEISDEDLFAICGGRTCHKGARHGLTQSGKLARIERQEKLLAKKLNKVKITDNSDENCACEKKLKKLKKHSKSDVEDQPSTSRHQKLKKKKHKRKKSVSFSETVVEYTISEPEAELQTTDESLGGCSSSSSNEYQSPKATVEIHALNDNNNYVNDLLTTDEGIELDCEDYNENRGGQQNFSEMQIKKKDKKKKKKLKDRHKAKDADLYKIEEAEIEEKEEDVIVKKKKKRSKRDAHDVDIDLIKKIKRKKVHQQNMEISELSDGLEEFKISE